MQAFAHGLGEMFLLHGKRYLVQCFHIQILDHLAVGNITEQGNLVPDGLVQGNFRAAYNDIRLDPHALQFLDTGLGGLGFQLLGCFQVWDQSDMDENGIFMSHIQLELPDGFQERLALNVADGAAHLDNGDLCFPASVIPVETALQLIGDVGDHLHGAAAVVSPALLGEYRPVNLAGSDITLLVQALVDETLVMSQIQIRLRSVIRHKYFSVLDGVHGTRVDIDIRVKFLHGHLVATHFQKSSQRGGGNSLSQTGNNTTCHKNVLYSHSFLHSDYKKYN